MNDKELLELVADAIEAALDANQEYDGLAQAAIDTMRANGYVHIDELTERAEKKIREEDNLYNNTGGKCGDSLSYHRYIICILSWLKEIKVEMHDENNPDNWNKCPTCGGEADNGHDRCLPPAAYLCSKCEEAWETNP